MFAVHCVDQNGKTVLVKPKVSRAALPELIAGLPPSKAKAEGRYRGRVADAQKHELIRTLRLTHGKSLRETARLAGVSK